MILFIQIASYCQYRCYLANPSETVFVGSTSTAAVSVIRDLNTFILEVGTTYVNLILQA